MEVLWWLPTVFTLVGIAAGYYVHAILTKLKTASAVRDAQLTLAGAKRDAEVIRKDAELKARDEVLRAREAFENEIKSRRQEIVTLEDHVSQRETNLDRKVGMLDKKEMVLDEKIADLEKQQGALKVREQELQGLFNQARERLQQVASMSQDEARKVLMHQLEEDLKHETGALIRRFQDEAKENSEKEARRIITIAIERYAADTVGEVTTSTVNLPNDEMKGRIIGREGRNIRALEAATGMNILIDDTPEVVVISGFDPMRREVARLALERLMVGWPHPSVAD